MAKTVGKKVTIKDVAKAAGVSISTVSNALNNVDSVHPDTKEKVMKAVKQLKYTPDLNGRNLKAHATGVFGLFIREINGPYYGELSDSVYRACKENGYELEIFLSSDPVRIMTNILGHRVDGAIIMNSVIGRSQEQILKENDIPTVYIDRVLTAKKSSSVVFDSYNGGRQAARFLTGLGHKRLMFIEGIRGNYDSIERKRGFLEELEKSKITIGEDYILAGDFEKENAYKALSEFIRSKKQLPEAIFAANDVSAMGALEALKDAGIKVPDEVSVMGCDNIETTRIFSPSVTTIHTNIENQGLMAVEQLVRMIKGQAGELITLTGSIIERDSTSKRQ